MGWDLSFEGERVRGGLFAGGSGSGVGSPGRRVAAFYARRLSDGVLSSAGRPLPLDRRSAAGASADGSRLPTLEQCQKLVDERCPIPIKLSNPRWTSYYRVHHRIVSKLQEGRVFVAGDAAHIHSPAAAQGMNTGIQDAFNLAWKLALVCEGVGGEKLLATYNEERYPVERGRAGDDGLASEDGFAETAARAEGAGRFAAAGVWSKRVSGADGAAHFGDGGGVSRQLDLPGFRPRQRAARRRPGAGLRGDACRRISGAACLRFCKAANSCFCCFPATATSS